MKGWGAKCPECGEEFLPADGADCRSFLKDYWSVANWTGNHIADTGHKTLEGAPFVYIEPKSRTPKKKLVNCGTHWEMR